MLICALPHLCICPFGDLVALIILRGGWFAVQDIVSGFENKFAVGLQQFQPSGKVGGVVFDHVIKINLNAGAKEGSAQTKKASHYWKALWAQKDSNLRLAACKAATLNQLSYAPYCV